MSLNCCRIYLGTACTIQVMQTAVLLNANPYLCRLCWLTSVSSMWCILNAVRVQTSGRQFIPLFLRSIAKQYKLKICSKKTFVNNVDMSSLRAPWQNGPYKNKHTDQHTNTQNTKTQQTFRKIIIFFVIFRIS